MLIPVEYGTKCVVILSPPSLAPNSTILGPSFVTFISVCDGPFSIPTALLASIATFLFSLLCL